MIVGIIELIDGFLGKKELRFHCLLHGIPFFNTYEHIPPAQESKNSPDPSGVGDLPVNVVVFDQAPNLSVQHPVKLREQDHIIPIMPVLGEKGQPGTPVRGRVFPGIKEQLRFIYVDLNFSLPEPASEMVCQSPGEPEQLVRIQTMVGNIKVYAFTFLYSLSIKIKVTDHHGSLALQPACNLPGSMAALPGSGSSGVQRYHNNSPLLTTRSVSPSGQ